MESELFKTVIADAKAVRETALQNAKAVLEEAFTPKLQSMLSRKLQQEMVDSVDDDDVEGIDEYDALDNSGLCETEVPANSADPDKSGMKNGKSQIAASDQDTNQTPDNNTAQMQKQNSTLTPSKTDKSDMKGSAGQIKASDQDTNVTPDNDTSSELHLHESDEDAELNEIIAELEGELDMEDDSEMDMEMGDAEMGDEEMVDGEFDSEMDDEEIAIDDLDAEDAISDDEVEGEESAGELPVDDVADDDEEIDLDEILREMEMGPEEEGLSPKMEEMYEQIQSLQKENAEYKKAFGYLRGKLNEVNLLNAKLLYTNKVFKTVALNESQKMRVVEAFDRTRNVREVKLTYTNLRESFKLVNAGKKRTLSEGVASQAVKSTAPSQKTVARQKQILAEGNEMVERMKKLANIKS